MATPTVNILSEDIYEFVESLPKIDEKKTFKKDKIISNSYTFTVRNPNNRFSLNHPNSLFSTTSWLYTPITITGTKNELIWNGIVTNIEPNHQKRIVKITSKNSFYKFRNAVVEYESSDWETPANAAQNILDNAGFTDYNVASFQRSINAFNSASTLIKCNFNRSDGAALQSVVEKLGEWSNSDVYAHNNEVYFQHWTPFTGGANFSVTASDMDSLPVIDIDEGSLINNYKIRYIGGTATDATGNNIGSKSRTLYTTKDLQEMYTGELSEQIVFKDFDTAQYIGEGYIKRTHKNHATDPKPLIQVKFDLKWSYKDQLNLTTFFKMTLEEENWTDKIFEIFKFTIDEDKRNIKIIAFEVD
jgi:hypothetical protein